ncbi:DNA polymerase/primase [Thiohalocapsa phage LS06-2018-MD04]|nr:DNA polymerase/primase [Thiohalocapsa phage LS06-2018-MD04]
MTALNLSTVNKQSHLDAALTYAAYGIRVFPCEPGKKVPLQGCMWTREATTDFNLIIQWWTRYPQANIGLAMGNGWVALDLDRKPDRDGWKSYLGLGGNPKPPWPMQSTPSGGGHFLFRTDEVFKNFVNRGEHGGLDLRSLNGCILGAPSVVGGKTYRWIDGDPDAPIPEGLLQACRQWSQAGVDRGARGSIKVAPAEMDPWDVDRWVEALELGPGEGTGDRSLDGYMKAKQAFGAGLTLEQMATVFPESWLATIGETPPHSASNPLRWGWRYIVCSAWRDRGVVLDWLGDEEKESPPGEAGKVHGGGGGQKIQESEASSMEVVFDLVNSRAERLEEGDVRGLEQIIAELAAAGLPELREAQVCRTLKTSTGLSLADIRKALRVRRDTAQAAKAVERGEGRPKDGPVFIRAQDKVLVPGEGLLSRPAFVTARAKDHGGSRETADSYWLTGERCMAEQVHDMTYDPAQPPGVCRIDGTPYYNLYRPSALEAAGDGSEASVRPWLDLLDSLGLEEGQQGKDALLDWSTVLVQSPGTKINHGLLMGGEPGIGKDSWLEPILDCVGRRNVSTIGGDDLAKNFNGWVNGAKLTVIEEIDYGDHKDRRTVTERLKRVLAAPPLTLLVDEKNLRPYEIPNRIQLFAMTNHRQCLEVQTGERRWLALWCRRMGVQRLTPENQRAWADWFVGYYDWLENMGGTAAVLAYLRGRKVDVRRVAGSPPLVTGWLREMQESSDDPLAAWIRDHSEGRVGLFAQDTIATPALMEWLSTGVALHWGVSGPISTRRLARALHAAGYVRERVRKGRLQSRIWVRQGAGIPDADKAMAERIGARKILRFPERRAETLSGD